VENEAEEFLKWKPPCFVASEIEGLFPPAGNRSGNRPLISAGMGQSGFRFWNSSVLPPRPPSPIVPPTSPIIS